MAPYVRIEDYVHTGVPVEVDETPVIGSYHYFLAFGSFQSVHMGSVCSWWEDTLHPPSQFAAVGGPLFVSELCSPTGNLSQLIHIPEQQLISSTHTLHGLAIPGPVQLSNERVMSLQRSLQTILRPINIVNVYLVVV